MRHIQNINEKQTKKAGKYIQYNNNNKNRIQYNTILKNKMFKFCYCYSIYVKFYYNNVEWT